MKTSTKQKQKITPTENQWSPQDGQRKKALERGKEIDPQKQHPASAFAYCHVIYHLAQQVDYNVLMNPENRTSCMHDTPKLHQLYIRKTKE